MVSMATIEKNGDHYELDGKRIYFGQSLMWISPDGGRMIVFFKLATDGAPQLWTINGPLLIEGQERFRRTGQVPLVDDALVLMSGDPLAANLEWTR
jgi:hypothetical protein